MIVAYNLRLIKSLSHKFVSKTGLDLFLTFACDWECVLDIATKHDLGIVLSQSYGLESVLDIIGSEKYDCEKCDKQCVLYINLSPKNVT